MSEGISAFPKIYTLGKREIENIFKGEVEITEKVDGSQFCFGVNHDGEIVLRSKGQVLYLTSDNMFNLAVKWLNDNKDMILSVLAKDTYVYGEFLNKPKHNVLVYGRVPVNNIMVFGVKVGLNFVHEYEGIKKYADALGLETVPLVYKGVVENVEQITELVTKTTSVLGNEIIEGIVVKNYSQHTVIGDKQLCFGKYVREGFKERHGGEWKAIGNKLEDWIKSFQSEARWQKAVIHLREKGLLEDSPKDIGNLFKEIHHDILKEETDEIKEFLFKHHIDRIKRVASAGCAEWYKDQLLKRAFPEANQEAVEVPVENVESIS
jgi:hypothetical protein